MSFDNYEQKRINRKYNKEALVKEYLELKSKYDDVVSDKQQEINALREQLDEASENLSAAKQDRIIFAENIVERLIARNGEIVTELGDNAKVTYKGSVCAAEHQDRTTRHEERRYSFR